MTATSRLRRALARMLAPLAILLLGAAAATACADLDVTNPNSRSTETFWRTQADAVAGTNAVYAGLLPLGVYSRWQIFVNDLRTDVATSTSPNPEIRNLGRFVIGNYDQEHNIETWRDHYRALFRANQAIANLPGVDMDAALRDRLVGEAKFLRALLYWNLVNYYGGNIPLIVEPTYDPATRVPSSTVAAVYAQIEKDLNEAIPALPLSYAGTTDVGRVTKGAAQTLLGKALLQQGPQNAAKYAQASTALAAVIASGRYSLMPNYADNFHGDPGFENNAESIFEVQMGDQNTLSANIPGLSLGTFVAPCGGPGFCDLHPTRWYFDQFFVEPTTTGGVDPRADATFFFNQPARTELVWDRPYNSLWGGAGDNRIWFKKYTEWYNHSMGGFNRFDAPINFRVLRYADVLLMQAEALNEQNQPGAAVPFVNQVRRRAQLADLPAGINQATLRSAIRQQRLLEFGLEAQRWFDLVRWGLLANPAELATHDQDFASFQVGKSELLPIPASEVNRNPLVDQNPNW